MAVSAGLFVALNNALTGLTANKQALATLSQNIANVNTPGYSRQVVNLENNVVGGIGEGVSVESITRQVNQFLDRAAQAQNSVVSNQSVLNDYNTSIQTLLGQPNGSSSSTTDTSIASAITSFFTSLQQLATTPTDASLQVSAVQSGQNVAGQISTLASGLENLRYQADQQINQDVGTVNNILKNLQSTNLALATAETNGGDTADLLDQRDQQITQLSQYMDINYYFDSNQEVHISTNGGTTLLDNALYQLSYQPQSSGQSFSSGAAMNPIYVNQVNSAGEKLLPALTMVTGGAPASVSTAMENGEIAGLLQIRDQQIPQMLTQMDNLASTVTDQVNAIHNSGSSFPGANSYTGQRVVSAGSNTGWTGNVQIALLGADGQAADSPYASETNGVTPLNLDLSTLDSGSGAGFPTVQGIINAINNYYQPQNKASLGDLSNIQLASDSPTIPTAGTTFNFDFNLQNLSANSSSFFVSGATITDASGNPAGTVTTTQPATDLASTGTYTTTAGSTAVTVTLASPITTLKDGDYIYLSQPPGPVDGISAANMGGYFQVSNISGDTFQINTLTPALNGGSWDESPVTATTSYADVAAGDTMRTGANGDFAVNLTNPTTPSYTVTVDVATQNADGTLSQGTIQYTVLNPATNTMNALYGAAKAGGSATITKPSSYTPLVTAELVDPTTGNALPTINGGYPASSSGYLKIVATDPSNVIAINSEDSQQIGFPNDAPPVAGTNRGFSYYFGLNNFFNENTPTSTGDTVAGSAVNMSIESRLTSDPSLISLGQLTQAVNNDGTPNYTYQRAAGDNSVITQLGDIGSVGLNFTAAGGLGNTTATLNGYAGQIISFSSAQATNIQNNYTNANTIYQGLQQQVSSTSGVNLDQELANTIIYQNAYSASARIITITNDMFSTLLQAFQG